MKKSDEERAREAAYRLAEITDTLQRSGGSTADYFKAVKAAYELGFMDGSDVASSSIFDTLKEFANYRNN